MAIRLTLDEKDWREIYILLGARIGELQATAAIDDLPLSTVRDSVRHLEGIQQHIADGMAKHKKDMPDTRAGKSTGPVAPPDARPTQPLLAGERTA